jgi:hypothetical protein
MTRSPVSCRNLPSQDAGIAIASAHPVKGSAVTIRSLRGKKTRVREEIAAARKKLLPRVGRFARARGVQAFSFLLGPLRNPL